MNNTTNTPDNTEYTSVNHEYADTAYTHAYPASNIPKKTPKRWSTPTLALVAALSLVAGIAGGAGITTVAIGLKNLYQYHHNYVWDNDFPDIDDILNNPSFPRDTPIDNNPSRSSSSSTSGIVVINSILTGGLGTGTGIVISSDGYITTNYHVVEGSSTIEVKMPESGRSYTATLLGHDAQADVALLKINDVKNLDYIEFDTSDIGTGETISVIGNAGGQGYLSRLEGTVTALHQNINATTSGNDSEDLTGLIKTDADVVQGYSGGPMLRNGKAIGMTVAASTSTHDTDTDGYAIPAQTVVDIVKQIQSGKTRGSIIVGKNPALGVTVSSENAQSVGVSVLSVNTDSPASKAGIREGDAISAVNGNKVSSAKELSSVIKTFRVGEKVTITFVSLGEEKTAEVTLEESTIN